MKSLPENPTEDQLKAIVEQLIREEYEDDAEVQSLEISGGGWIARYLTGGEVFEIEYDGVDFIKGPIGATEIAEDPADLEEFTLGDLFDADQTYSQQKSFKPFTFEVPRICRG